MKNISGMILCKTEDVRKSCRRMISIIDDKRKIKHDELVSKKYVLMLKKWRRFNRFFGAKKPTKNQAEYFIKNDIFYALSIDCIHGAQRGRCVTIGWAAARIKEDTMYLTPEAMKACEYTEGL